MADLVQRYPGVEIASGAEIGAYCILGHPARGRAPEDALTVIGCEAVLRSHTVIYHGNRIGDRFQTGHGALVREDNEIGDDVSVGSGTVIEHHVRIANGVRIHSQVFVPEYSVLEANCWLGPNVVLTNAKYPRSPGVKSSLAGPVVREGAKIGANSTILPGVEIGRDALVGAGSVVTKDVPARSVVVGNPARILGSLDDLPYDFQPEAE